MAAKKQLRSSRSKSCGRLTGKVPFSPTSDATQAASNGRPSRSPARNKNLPAEVNNTAEEESSHSDGQVNTLEQEQQPLTLSDNNFDHSGNGNNIPQVSTQSNHEVSPITTALAVGDNTVSPRSEAPDDSNGLRDHPDPTKVDPGKALLLVLAELQEIKSQMVKLSQMESTTASIAEQLASNVNKTGELEKEITSNTSSIQEIKKDHQILKTKVESQDAQLVSLQKLKEEIEESSGKTVKQMNDLIETQRQQVDTFNSGSKQLQIEWQKEIMVEVDKRFESLKNERHLQSLKDQAFKKRQNLVLVNVPEDTEKTTTQIVKDFFSEALKIQNVKVLSSFRLGSHSGTGTDYARPILVRFGSLEERNLIWKNKADITNEKNDKKIRIQADLPKVLREGIPTLYKVAKAASKIEEFSDARVRDYQLEMNDQVFQISDLEQLPVPIRPSTLAAPKSDTHMVFYSRHARLSNHHPSNFTIKGQGFSSMEHFLATRRAELSGREDMISKAKEVKDPVQAKYILNTLHGDHQQEWDQGIEGVAMEGLRAKFVQNRPLHDYLCSTGKLILGEASTNATWGIGMDINNAEVLDHSKWSVEGNLLGRSLMKLRTELLKKKNKTK